MVAPLVMMGLTLAGKVAGGLVDSLTSQPASGQATDKTKKTASDFEKMFLEQAFDRLTENGGEDGPLGEAGTGGSVFRSMLAKEYAGQIVKSGGLGIADQVYRQMLQLQEVGRNGG